MVVNQKKIQYGQFTTPLRYVGLAAEWLSSYIDSSYIILDSSCGNGVFFALSWSFPSNRFIGADIDEKLINRNILKYSFLADFYHRNSLFNVSRSAYRIQNDAKLCVVGNPPYNDSTSKSKRQIKQKLTGIDCDIKSRDLGLSFLNSYNKLRADIVLILHPFSYLIKRANRREAGQFFDNYKLERHIIFSSKVFDGTNKSNQFPVILGLYRRDGEGTRDIECIEFKTEEGDSFRLADYTFVSQYCSKYPGKRTGSGIWFYSMRDVNALKRNRSFVKNPTKSCLEVDESKLGYYCWCDLFKRFAKVPYWMGNFDIPLPKNGLTCSELEVCCRVSKYLNRDIFGEQLKPGMDDFEDVLALLRSVGCFS